MFSISVAASLIGHHPFWEMVDIIQYQDDLHIIDAFLIVGDFNQLD